MRNAPDGLRYLKTWSSVDGAIWEWSATLLGKHLAEGGLSDSLILLLVYSLLPASGRRGSVSFLSQPPAAMLLPPVWPLSVWNQKPK